MIFIGIIFGGSKLIASKFSYLIISDRNPDKSRSYSNYYSENNRKTDFLLSPEIQSQIVSDKAIKLFIPLFDNEISLLQATCNIEFSDRVKDKTEEEKNRIRQTYLNCYQNQNRVYLNNQLIKTDFLKTYHPKTEQYGIVSYINLNDLDTGQHELKIIKQLAKDNVKEWYIPFFYSPD